MPSTAKAPEALLRPVAGADTWPVAPLLGADPSLMTSAFLAPERIVLSAWLGHIPFAFWIVALQKPKILVELGTHNGASYSAFCQAIATLGLDTRAYAVDTWEGDPHAGHYGEEVLAELRAYLEPHYGSFSRLIRSTFDDARPGFADGSIDLLHIDGCHTYEAVRHDFESWRPKLSERAIVLFHDTEVRQGDFGVWRFWEEIRTAHPSFNFVHHHGLGVLAVGAVQNPAIRQFLAADVDEAARQNIRQIFARLGAGVQCEFDLRQLVEQRDSLAAQRDSLTSQLGMATAEREALEHSIGQQTVELATIQQQREAIALELARHQRKHKKLTGSLSWKLTRPLRSLQMLFRSMRTHKRGSQQPKALSSSPLPPALQPFTSHAAPEPFREPGRSLPNPGAELRVCCLVHLFYTELWEELAADLRMLDGIAHDVFVNLVEETATNDVKARIRAAIPTARVLVSPNRGRDAGGIISLMALVDVAKYDVVLVLHGKSSVNLAAGDGERWRRALIEPLLGSRDIARQNVELMAGDSTVGLIGSAACHSTFPGNNKVMTRLLATRLGIAPIDAQPPFVAGAMFMIRPQLMGEIQQALRGLPFLAFDAEVARGAIDGQLEHAVERIYGILAAARGLRVVWRDPRATEALRDVDDARPTLPATLGPRSGGASVPGATTHAAASAKDKSNKRPRSKTAGKLRQLRKILKHGAGWTARVPTAPPAQLNPTYVDWVQSHDTLSKNDYARIRNHIQTLRSPPLISVIMPVYNTDETQLYDAIDSVRNQIYPHWELCIANDASTLPHVRRVLDSYWHDRRVKIEHRDQNGHIAAASNSALALAGGEFVALMDHDDLLPPQALYEMAVAIVEHPDADLIYSDEDHLDEFGVRQNAYFKSDWDPDLLLAQNMISHLGVYRRSILQAIGGFRLGYEGSQDYDLTLRFSRATTADRIHHIPAVLYHWRQAASGASFSQQALEKCVNAARRAIGEHLQAIGVEAEIVPVESMPSWNRIIYPLPAVPPLVSVIIPTRDRSDLLRTCLDGLRNRTDYDRLEIIVVDNDSTESSARQLLDELDGEPGMRVLPFPGPFNYSAMNNLAVAGAAGDIVLLLNNDIEIIEPSWLRELVSQALRPGIGAVGAKLIYPNGLIQHAGVAIGVGGVAGHVGHLTPRANPGYFGMLGLARSVSAVTAACLAVRREAFLEVGGMDAENLKVAFNDVDFCLRLRAAGYRNFFTPFAELYHHESVSRGSDLDPDKVERFVREVNYMKHRWGDALLTDPYYNINFSLNSGNFVIAQQPRRQKPWLERQPSELAS